MHEYIGQEFAAVYQDTHDDIYRFLMKLTLYDAYLSEELTQETFYRAYLGIASFRGQCQIKTWLCQIAKITYFSYLRKTKKIAQLNFEHPKQGEEALLKNEFPKNTIEEAYERQEIICELFKIMGTFNELTQNVMIYRLYFDMPYSEISKLLQISESSARVIYHRGKIVLKNKLREEYAHEI